MDPQEHQLEILSKLPGPVLVAEEGRILERIKDLQVKRMQIGQVLAERALNEDNPIV